MELDIIIKNLEEGKDSEKLEALLELESQAKKGEKITKALQILNKLLFSKNNQIWQETAWVLKYYYQHYISFYCRNFGSFLKTIEKLFNTIQEIRKKAINYLNTYYHLSEPRKWKYLEKKKIKEFKKAFESEEEKELVEKTEELHSLSRALYDISPMLSSLELGLTSENENIRWNSADALGFYISNYMFDSPNPYNYVSEKLKDSNLNRKLSYINSLDSSIAYDLVSDRDERDISHSIPAIAILLFSKDEKIRLNSIKILYSATKEHDLEISLPIIIKIILNPKMKNLHGYAASILKDLIGKGFNISSYIEELLHIFSLESEHNLKKDIILVLRKAVEEGHDISKFIPIIENLLLNDDEEVKFGATDTLSYFYARTARWEDLEKLMEHDDKDVRQEAVGTLKVVKDAYNIFPIFPKLKKLLKDEDKEVRFVAARTLLARFEDMEAVSSAIPIMVQFCSDPEQKIVNNAYITISNWIKDNITCKSKIPKSEWDSIKSFIMVMEKLKGNVSKEIKESIHDSLVQYYVHTSQFDKLKKCLKTGSIKEKKGTLFRLTTCGYSDCKMDVSPMIPDLIEIYFNHENSELKNYAMRKLEDIISPKNAEKIIKQIQEYSINKRWELEKKLRKISKRSEIHTLEKKNEKKTKKESFKQYISLLNNENPIIREWASEEIWNFVYDKEIDLHSLIPYLIENLKDSDPYVRQISVSLLSEVAKGKKIFEIIPLLSNLMLDKSEKIRHSTAYTLYILAENYDIKETIPNLLKNINNPSKDVWYFSIEALTKYVRDKNSAKFVLNQLKRLKISQKNKGIKKLIDVCNELLKQDE